jgi:hypothetical protein
MNNPAGPLDLQSTFVVVNFVAPGEDTENSASPGAV